MFRPELNFQFIVNYFLFKNLMPLFQSTVVSKYLKAQDQDSINLKWKQFKKHFHNPSIQENIRNSNEEQYQGEFLIDLFVNILGYTKNPTPDFNLTTEYKNVKDGKKADGAIIIGDEVKAVIELKGTETTDLNKVETQAFGYKNNQPNCRYVVTSNFEKLRFYVDNAIEFIDFHLFELTEDDFALLYLCLAYENITKDLPSKIKNESLSQEDAITKQLYKDYSIFKKELHQNLVTLNPKFDSLTLFKKSQKLLDRFLFLFFAEDRLLLPPNSVRLVLSDFKDLMDKDVDTTLYKRFQKYFGYLNTGFKGKRYDVFAYNGGLFEPDEVLQEIIIDDALLYDHTLKLSEYDFESEVDVNILGHIFENSLTEIEEVQAELEGQEIDKTKTKRKKDGVFYTPKYITKYIVENTVGKLCGEKKQELDITDEAYLPAKQRSRKRLDNLQAYREWLLQITICDPACGSGAFLNQALEFLIAEHRYIDELSAKYNKDSLVLSDVENGILENNLFGVDINEESMEIAKLSLWLRTAQKNRKLNDLSNNIKCGNSLVDDKEIDGEKAFKWKVEFPKVFSKGGFDIVIGNPPYGSKMDDVLKQHLKHKFSEVHMKMHDLYIYFINQSIHTLLKPNGRIGFIVPNTLLFQLTFENLRKYILENLTLSTVINLGGEIFEDAEVPTCIFSGIKNKSSKYDFEYLDIRDLEIKSVDFKNIEKSLYSKSDLFKSKSNVFGISKTNQAIIDRLENNTIELNSIVSQVSYGIGSGGDKIFRLKGVKCKEIVIEEHLLHPVISGGNISRYGISYEDEFIIYITKNENEKQIPNTIDYLQQFKKKLSSKRETLKGLIPWWSLHWPRNKELFSSPKLVLRQTGDSITASFDDFGYFVMDSVMVIKLLAESKYNYETILAILNSRLSNFYYNQLVQEKGRTFAQVKPQNIRKLRIPLSIKQEIQLDLVEKVRIISSNNQELIDCSNKLLRTIIRKFEIEVLSRKLGSWFDLSFSEFIIELKKKKIKLSLSEEAEWEDYFLKEQKVALAIKKQIDQTDREIDQMVYELYELTEEEIKIIENS